MIRLEEEKDAGPGRFKGTQITLFLSRGGGHSKLTPPSWEEIVEYLRDICQDLPYPLHLEHVASDGGLMRARIDAAPLAVHLPPHLEALAVRIPVADREAGLEGEIVIISPYVARQAERELAKELPFVVLQQMETAAARNRLLRGGFKVGRVPGLPDSYLAPMVVAARLRLNWRAGAQRRYPTPRLARDGVVGAASVERHVLRLWLGYLLDHVDDLPEGLLYGLQFHQFLRECEWLERYDALTLYRLARQGWEPMLREGDEQENSLQAWEEGRGQSPFLGQFKSALHWRLLDLVLPRVTTLQMAGEARFYVKPPRPGWQTTLEGWHEFITSPIRWGPFVEYVGSIAGLLVDKYPGASQFNSRFRERLINAFDEDEYTALHAALCKLVESRSYGWTQAELTERENELFQTASDSLGDLEIGSIHGTWRIESFAPTDIVPLA